MALRRWRGVLVQENTQTGDGRICAPGSIEWAPLPLPLAYLVDGDQHVDLIANAPQIGTIDTITRVGDDVTGAGFMDDAIPEAAELIRRLEAGSASGGSRQGLSIDPDNWAVELWDTTVDEVDGAAAADEDMTLVASVSGTGVLPAIRAAAGDPDSTDNGVLLMTDESGAWLERYTRLRIRGVTACAVAAFAGAYMELDGAAETEDAPAEDAPTEPAATVRASAGSAPSRPPREWFDLPEPQPGMTDDGSVYGMPVQELLVEQPDGGMAVPLTWTEDGRVFGHLARWGQCHVGYLDECVTAPPSNAAYAHYHVGQTVCADGSLISTGSLTVNCDHAAAHLMAPEARDHYAHAGLQAAALRATNGTLGVWACGAWRPDLTEDQMRVLRASSASGDWRRIGADLEFIGALAVNVPGFPIAREFVTASGLSMPRASLAASAHVDQGRVVSLTASGVVQRCSDCQRRAMSERGGARLLSVEPDPRLDDALGLLRTLELRTRHMVPTAAEHAMHALRREPAMASPRRILKPRR